MLAAVAGSTRLDAREDVLEAELVSEIRATPRRSPRPGPRWRAIGMVAAVAAGAAAIRLSTGSEAPPAAGRAATATRGADATVVPNRAFVAVPAALVRLTARAPLRVAFVTVEDEPPDRAPLYRLWRLELPAGALVPGPVVGEALALRYAPPPFSARLAFLVGGGGLFELQGFLASRPEWVAGEVSAFGFGHRGSLVFGRVERRHAPWGAGLEATVTVARTAPGSGRAVEQATRRVLLGALDHVLVRSGRMLLAGSRDGEPTIITIAPDGVVRVRRGGVVNLVEERATRGGTSNAIAVRSATRGFDVVDLASGRRFRIDLPIGFPDQLGPIAVA